jgi:hypothetical protein
MRTKSWQTYVGDVLTLVPFMILAGFFFAAGIVEAGISFTLLIVLLFWLTVLRLPPAVETDEAEAEWPPGSSQV